MAVNEGLTAVGWPHIVERTGVPDGFHEYLRHSHGVGGGAGVIHEEETGRTGSTKRVCNMCLNEINVGQRMFRCNCSVYAPGGLGSRGSHRPSIWVVTA